MGGGRCYIRICAPYSEREAQRGKREQTTQRRTRWLHSTIIHLGSTPPQHHLSTAPPLLHHHTPPRRPPSLLHPPTRASQHLPASQRKRHEYPIYNNYPYSRHRRTEHRIIWEETTSVQFVMLRLRGLSMLRGI
jgi:hypothetical protein